MKSPGVYLLGHRFQKGHGLVEGEWNLKENVNLRSGGGSRLRLWSIEILTFSRKWKLVSGLSLVVRSHLNVTKCFGVIRVQPLFFFFMYVPSQLTFGRPTVLVAPLLPRRKPGNQLTLCHLYDALMEKITKNSEDVIYGEELPSLVLGTQVELKSCTRTVKM